MTQAIQTPEEWADRARTTVFFNEAGISAEAEMIVLFCRCPTS